MNKVLLSSTFADALGGLLFGYDKVKINCAMVNLASHFQLFAKKEIDIKFGFCKYILENLST